jgi:hypothetical protein
MSIEWASPSNKRGLASLVANAFSAAIPDVRVCEGHCSPLDAFAAAYFARGAPVHVWKASRGFGGKSFLLALLAECEAMFLGARASVLGGSGEQSARVLAYLHGFANKQRGYHLPVEMKREARLSNGAIVTALTASQKSARGAHPQRLRIDEGDEVELSVLDAALGQPMSGRNWRGETVRKHTVISSTHHYADGTMTEILRRAGERGWDVFEWCYRETIAGARTPSGWLDPAEVESKRLEVPESMWLAEYENQEPAPEDRAILPEKIERMFRLPVRPTVNGIYYEVEPPDAAGRYAHGADWARSKDRTVIVTFRTDCKPRRLVAFEQLNRMPWPEMIARWEARHARYGRRCRSAHDATGIGDVVEGVSKTSAKPIILSGRTRADLFSEYIAAIEREEYSAPALGLLYTEHKHTSRADLFGAGHPPDSFVACALAHHAETRYVEAAWAAA